MLVSSTMPVTLAMLRPRGVISAIYCRANLPTCYPPAPRGFRVLGAVNGWVDLENLATGTHATVKRQDISYVRVFITWEV